MTKDQLQRSLKLNGKPVKVVGGQLIIPESLQPKPREEEKNDENLHTDGVQA